MTRLFLALPMLLAALLAGCSTDYLTSSGAAYLAEAQIGDPGISHVAAYEPELTFPGRIGVVRLVYGQVRGFTPEEARVYSRAMALAGGMGQVVTTFSGLDARMTDLSGRMTADHIRRLAVSRHLDYVLVMAFDPGRNRAEAIFMDVSNGYPYASTEVDLPGGHQNFWGGPVRNPARIDRITETLGTALAPELERMLRGLRDRAA